MRHFFAQRAFTLAFIGNLLAGLSFNLFLHLPALLVEFGADEILIGLLMGASAIAALAARIGTGVGMDRLGQRPVIVTGHLVNIVCVSLYLGVDSIGPLLWTARLTQGLAEGVLLTSYMVYAAEMVPADRRAQGIAIFGVSAMLPLALGGFLGDWAIATWGFTGLFRISLACSMVAILTSLPLPEFGERSAAGSAGRGFLTTLTKQELRPIWVAVGGVAVAVTAYFTFLRTYVDATGIGTVGGFFGAYAITVIVLRLFAGAIPDRVGVKPTVAATSVLFAGGLVALATAETAAMVTAAGILCGAGHAFVFPVLMALTIERAPTNARGSATAIFVGLHDVAKLVGAPLLGWVVVARSYESMFLVVAVVFLTTMAVAVMVDRRLRPA